MTVLQALAHWQHNSEDECGRRPMPPELYASKAIHAIELEKIFKKEWICTAHISEFKNKGDFSTIDIAGHPVIVLRGDNDEIKAYSNVCAHRSSRLLDGCGNTKVIVCPYHAWSYNLDGKLRGAPRMDKNAVKDVCLNELRSEIWNGLIFVNLDENATALAPRLEALNNHVNDFNMSSKQVVHSYEGDVDCNWKVLVENFCESYHLFRVHKTTLEPDTPTSTIKIMPGGTGYSHHTMAVVAGKHLSDKPEDNIEHLSGIFPSTTFSVSKSWMIWLSIIPTSHNKLKFRAWVARQVPPGEEAIISKSDLDGVLAFMAEDKAINTGVQQGLEAGVGNKGPLHEFEKTNWDFGHYYAKIMLD